MAFAVLLVAHEHDQTLTIPDPANYEEARSGPDNVRWELAEQEELAPLEAPET